jgi:phosphate transport system substrate-binding protein
MFINSLKLGRLATSGLAAAALTVAGAGVSAVQAQTVKVDGSSTVYPITEAAAEGFQKQGGAKVTVGISGTGGGFKKFCKKETDISNASRKIKDTEKAACAEAGVKYIEIPVAIDALAVVINKDNTWATDLTLDELKKMWSPETQPPVTKWNQVRAGFPDAPLKLFGPGPDSGTFDYFTEKVVGKERSSRKDFTPSEDDNVLVQGVSRDKNALGYFGFAYYEANKTRIKSVKINGVEASAANVDNKTYPLARTIYIYVNADSAKKPEVKSFVEYYLTNATTFVNKVKYVPLKQAQYAEGLSNFRAGKTAQN